MSSACRRRLFRLVSRAVCIGLLALPLTAPPVEAAVKHRKAAKPGHGVDKRKPPASGRHAKAKKPKVHAKKPAGPKKQAVNAARTKVKAQAKAASAPKARIASVPTSKPVARIVPPPAPRVAAKAPMAPGRTAMEKPRSSLAGASAPAPAAEGLSEPPRQGTRVCRREGRIYLLADCAAPLPPALLATAPATGAMR